MDEKLKIALQDYVATVNSGKYGDDYTTLISKFPELTGFEKQSLDDYVATSNSGKYGDDWDLLNSKFPEFTSPKQNEVSGTGSKNTSGTSTEPSKTSQKPNWIQESGDVIQDTKGTTKFDLGLNRVEVENLQFEEPLIDEKTGRPLEVTYQAELTPEQDTGERSYLQNLENSLNNNLNQLKGFDERIVVTAGALSKKLLPILGSSAEELYQYAGLDFNEVMDTAMNELDRLAGETLETANFTEANNAKDFFSALTDSVLAVVNSALVARATFGVGLATDMIGGSISEANKTKADRLGISVEELYKTNQEDFYAPAILGSAGYLLERYGLKGVKQAINRKISSGLGRYLSTVAIDNNKEGVTEWLQYGGDSVNTFLAEGGRVEDAGEIFADALFSKQGLEMYLKGMAGSTAISAPSVIVNSISNSKTRTQAYKLDTERRKLIQELQNEFIAQNPITRDAVLTKIESISEELDALYNQDLSENKGNLTLEQTEEVNNLSSQITEIEQTLENPEISEEVKTALNEEKSTLQTKIDEVISNSNKQVEPKSGSRLFSTPVEGLTELSASYKQEKGITEPEGQPIRKLDEERSMRIADAYEAMEHAPNNPEVKRSYEAMATETVDQFDAITNAGYSVEIYEGEGEPYANSQEMLADLRDNKHLYVLPTEKEFGQTPITDTQRAENPLLRDSGKKDINGKPLLVNDVFRFVHDVFGHGERGNSFGAIGEENAWDVHARMYSPEARRAMTTETRGQNSWVNFGKHLRNEEGVVPKKGQAGFTEVTARPFAEQKIGLLPEEFSQLENNNQSVQQNETFTETEQSEIVNTEQTNSASPDLEIEGEVKTPTSEKLKEIEARREKIRERIRKRGGALSAGINPETLADYIALGATYVESGIVKFSEFVSNLKSDLPEKEFKKLNDKNLREIYTKSAEAQGYKIRKFSESVRTSKKVSDETKAIVQDSPETITYEPQVLQTATERVEALPELERLNKVATLSKATTSLSDSDNDAILAGISLINKYESEGRHEESAKIIQQMAKSATVMGQALRQYGEFKNSTPAGYMSLVEEALKEKGKELNQTNRTKIEAMYKELQGAIEAYQQAVELTGKDTSKKAWSDRKKAQIALEDANRKLSDYVAKVYGKSWGDVMKTILQGSLLTLKSQIINPFSNIVQGGVRAGINTNALIFDTIISNIWGLPKSKIGINATSIRLGARGVRDGLQTATRKAVRGDASLETNKFEISARLKPWESAKDLWYSMTEKEFREEFDQDFEDRFTKIIESTIGIVPNLMFRMLPFGDDPFFSAVRVLRLIEIGMTNKELRGKELEQFVNNPDEDSDMIATSYAKEATFQDPTKLAKSIQSVMRTVEDLVGNSELGKNKFIKGLTQVMLKQAVPFINTPSSIIWKTVSFSVPAIPALMAVNQVIKLRKIKGWESSPKKREEVINAKRKLVEYLGEATLATQLLSVASILVSMGLVTGDLPDEPERAKEKNFTYNTQPANTANISGLRRLLAGEDPTWQQGDYVVSYIPFGVLGAQIGIMETTLGKQLRDTVKKSKTISTEGVAEEVSAGQSSLAERVTGNWLGNLPAALTYVIGQPFVQSTEVMLTSLAKGDTGQWGTQMVRTLSNLVVPNAVGQAFRASNEYMRDIYTENDLETFGNIIKEKTANVEDLPMRYNMWGEPVKQSPEGTNPYVFQMLDIFRTQKILEDEVTYKVFDIYRKTKENSVIPNTVKDYYKDKDFTVKLTKQQKADLSRIVGEERRKRVEKVLRNYTKDSDPEKFVKQLRDAYSKGASQGKRILLKQMKEQGIDVKANIRAFRESVEDED